MGVRTSKIAVVSSSKRFWASDMFISLVIWQAQCSPSQQCLSTAIWKGGSMVNEEKEWNCRKFLFLWRGEFHENCGKNSRKEENNQDRMVSLCVERYTR